MARRRTDSIDFKRQAQEFLGPEGRFGNCQAGLMNGAHSKDFILTPDQVRGSGRGRERRLGRYPVCVFPDIAAFSAPSGRGQAVRSG